MPFGLRDFKDLTEEFQVLLDGQVAVQAEALGQVTEMLTGFLHLCGKLVTCNADRPAGGFKRAEHQADRSGLAGSIRADQADHFSCPHLEVQPVDGRQGVVHLDQVPGFEKNFRFHDYLDSKVMSAGMPGLSRPVVSSSFSLTAKTVFLRPDTVSTLRGVNSAWSEM